LSEDDLPLQPQSCGGGNPTVTGGHYQDAFGRNRAIWKTFTISVAVLTAVLRIFVDYAIACRMVAFLLFRRGRVLGRVRRWFRDFLNCFGCFLWFLASRGYVGLRDDPDQLPAPIDDRDPPHLILLHSFQSILQIILRMAGERLSGHHILYVGATCVAALSYHVEYQIAISDDSR
jgi:hypothetical protein